MEEPKKKNNKDQIKYGETSTGRGYKEEQKNIEQDGWMDRDTRDTQTYL